MIIIFLHSIDPYLDTTASGNFSPLLHIQSNKYSINNSLLFYIFLLLLFWDDI